MQAKEIHEDNIRWNRQMAGVDMIQSTRQQGSQEVIMLQRDWEEISSNSLFNNYMKIIFEL